MKQGDLISLVENFNIKEYEIKEQVPPNKMNENINTAINWDDLSGSEQMAVEFAEDDIKKGIDVKTAAIQACYRVSEGNADAAYFYKGMK